MTARRVQGDPMTETPAPHLRALRELAEAATPGPWTAEALGSEGCAVMGAPMPWGRVSRRPTVARCGHEDWQADRDTSAFIAAANPTAVLALLDRLEAAEAAVERVRACLRAAEWRDSSSLAVDLTGRPFASPIPQEDLRAALDAD